MQPFFKNLLASNTAHGNNLCVGIDPHCENLPGYFRQEAEDDIHGFLLNFSKAVIDAASGKVAAVKFQSAFFEAHGDQGCLALRAAIHHARCQNLLAILDAKRGDISSTMAAYATMAFRYFNADALTVLPYMGVSVLDPFRTWLENGKGLYVVWISSNKDAAALQNSIAAPLLSSLADWCRLNQNQESIGLVLGATKLSSLNDQLLHKATQFGLLLPGVGAQGAKVDAKLQAVLAQSPSSLYPVSRGLTGFGLEAEGARLGKIAGWPAYSSYVGDRIQRFLP